MAVAENAKLPASRLARPPVVSQIRCVKRQLLTKTRNSKTKKIAKREMRPKGRFSMYGDIMIHAYKLNDYNIVLDVNSGSIHLVDEVAFEAICLLEHGTEEAAQEYLRAKFDELTKSDISELFDSIAGLRDSGKLYAGDTYAGTPPLGEAPPLKALCLNVAHACNMRCSYCFAGRGEYGGDEGLMSLEIGKRAVDFLLKNSHGRRNLDIDFFGGEPLLNWEVVKGTVAYARSKERENGKNFRFTLTTNGVLIDDEVIEFSCKEMHNVVLSLDGRPEINDKHRVLPGGGGSYGLVLPKFRELVDARQGKGYYIRGTFTSENKDFVNDILHIASCGFEEISLEPAVAKPEEPLGFNKEDLAELFEQYEVLAKEMIERSKAGGGFKFYHFNLSLDAGPCVHKRIAGCGVGTEYMAVTPGGKLYPCHQFVGDESFVIGDVHEGITNAELLKQFGKWDIYSRPSCKDCWAKFYCSGGCAANAYHDTGDISGVYEIGCELFKKRLECAIMIQVAVMPTQP